MEKEKRNRIQIIISTVLVILKSVIYSLTALVCSGIAHDSNLFYCSDIFDYILIPFEMGFEGILIFFIPVFVFTIVELLTAKKLKSCVFEFFIPFLIALTAGVICYIATDLFESGMIVVVLFMLSIRCITIIIDLIIRKRSKLIPVFIGFSIISVLLYSSLLMYQDEIREKFSGVPDQTGSWGSINQEVKRDDAWQKIVTDSQFSITLTDEKITDDSIYEDYYICLPNTYPVIDGSTVCVPLAVEFARQHLDMDDETANSFVNFSTTHYAYMELTHKQASQSFFMNDRLYALMASDEGTNLILATQPSDYENELAAENGVTFVKKPICHDAFVFITHKDNPVESLTVEQIRNIYTGQITNWKDVGGNNKKISAYQREENSGSQTAMKKLVMNGAEMSDPISVPIIVGMGELVNAVAEYENNTSSIGYTYKYYIDTLYKNDNIKTIAIDGIEPNDDNIKNGTYPFSTSYYGIIRAGDEENTGGKFLDWILSEEGQKCVEQAGYIPVK